MIFDLLYSSVYDKNYISILFFHMKIKYNHCPIPFQFDCINLSSHQKEHLKIYLKSNIVNYYRIKIRVQILISTTQRKNIDIIKEMFNILIL